ncbi:MAG: tetratricopeptide repeat protein [Rhodothermales bacterium]
MRQSPCTFLTASIVLIGLCSFKPLAGWAQSQTDNLCDTLTQTVSIAYKNLKHTDFDDLALIVSTARRARMCYGNTRTQRRIWLLNKEVWGLDGLRRYEEANHLVDLFFEVFFEEASDEYKARFALHRLRLHSFQGDFTGAVIAYSQAQRNIHALPRIHELNLHLNGVYLYHETGRYEQSIKMAEEVLETILPNETATSDEELALVYGRALFLRGEARMMIEREKAASDIRVLRQIIDDLEAAATQFRTLETFDRYSGSLALLGVAYAEMGLDSLSASHFNTAFRIARANFDVKSEIFGFLCQGRVYSKQHNLRKAEENFTEALALVDSSGVEKHTSVLLFELGKVYEQQGRIAEAQTLFRRVLDQPREEFSTEALRTVATQKEAEKHLLSVLLTQQRNARNFWLFAFLGTLLLFFLSMGYALRSRSLLRAARASQPQPSRFTLPAEPLSVRRLAYLYVVLNNPSEVAALIQDDDLLLANRVKKGRFRRRTDLYLCVAAVEQAVEGRKHSNPEDTIRMDFYRYFKKKKWTWPSSVEEWRHHFEKHPPGASSQASQWAWQKLGRNHGADTAENGTERRS